MNEIELRPALPSEAPAISELALRSKAHWGYHAAFLIRRSSGAVRPDDPGRHQRDDAYYGMPIGLQIDGAPIREIGFGYNRQIVTDLLRTTMGFDGVVLTDWELINDNWVGDQVLPAQVWGRGAGPGEPDGADHRGRRRSVRRRGVGLFDDPFVDEDSGAIIAGEGRSGCRLGHDGGRRSGRSRGRPDPADGAVRAAVGSDPGVLLPSELVGLPAQPGLPTGQDRRCGAGGERGDAGSAGDPHPADRGGHRTGGQLWQFGSRAAGCIDRPDRTAGAAAHRHPPQHGSGPALPEDEPGLPGSAVLLR